MNRYSIFIHGIGTGTVRAQNRNRARMLAVQHVRQSEPLPYIAPMKIQKLQREFWQKGESVECWQAWDEDEPERVSNFRLLSVV